MKDLLKCHILCFKLNTVENYAFVERGFSKRLETKTTFAPSPSCFERKKAKKIRDVHASWKKVKCLYLYSTDTTFTQHKHDKYYSLQTKGQMPADKKFSKGTWNSKLTHSKFVALVIVSRFLLVKKLVSIKTAHALYRDNGLLTIFFLSNISNAKARDWQHIQIFREELKIRLVSEIFYRNLSYLETWLNTVETKTKKITR